MRKYKNSFDPWVSDYILLKLKRSMNFHYYEEDCGFSCVRPLRWLLMLPVMEVEYMSYHRRRKTKPRRRFIKESMHKSLREGSSVPPPPLPWKIQTWNWVKTIYWPATKKTDFWNSVKATNLPHPGEIEWGPRLLYTQVMHCISTSQGITCRWRHLLIFKVGYMALTVYRTSEWSCYFWRFAITWRFAKWTTKLTLDNFQWLGLLTSFFN